MTDNNLPQKQPLFAGPWVGEFGWELFCFQGFVRAMAKKHSPTEVVVCTRPGNEWLYEDVIREYGGRVVTQTFPFNAINSWKNEDVAPEIIKKLYRKHTSGQAIWLKPDNYFRGFPGGLKPIYAQPVKSDGGERFADVLLHARKATHCNSSFRNWDERHAADVALALRNTGLMVASIGLSATSCHIKNTMHFLDLSLTGLTQVMGSAKVHVGPLSGPAHFATLCGLPQVTWVSHIHHEIRARHTWNPFSTPLTVFSTPTNDYWRQRKPFLPDKKQLIDAILAAVEGEFK